MRTSYPSSSAARILAMRVDANVFQLPESWPEPPSNASSAKTHRNTRTSLDSSTSFVWSSSAPTKCGTFRRRRCALQLRTMASIFLSAKVSATSDPGGRRIDFNAADNALSSSTSLGSRSSVSFASREPRSEYRLLWCLPAATTWCALGRDLKSCPDASDAIASSCSARARVSCARRVSTPCARCHSSNHASPSAVPPSARRSRSRGARVSRAAPRSSRVAR
mmetsp:Transcript_14598/g.62571  ORF Transcript_14598/g.62571 Transcript_14598/m.62571 type:complete len:222 (-) Transcript_14598:145-810(-)